MTLTRRQLLLASTTLPSLTSCANDLAQHRERPVEELAKDLNVCACAYAVLRSGRAASSTLLSGCANPSELGEPIFQAASLTKPVIAFAALNLVVDGQLSLDARVSRYLPSGYTHFHSMLARLPDDPHDVVLPDTLSRISIAALLNHTSGLPNWSSGSLSLGFEPGQRWSYSGEGFVLLQSVIEAVTGMELSAYFDKHVFERLDMSDTRLTWSEDFSSRVVNGTSVLGRARHIRFLQPVAAASLYTTATDYANFMSAVLAKDQIVALIQSRSVWVDRALGIQWGLGWGIEHSEGGPYLWQWGNNPGYRAFAMASMTSKNGFVVLTNSERGMPLAASLAHAVVPAEHSAFRSSLLG